MKHNIKTNIKNYFFLLLVMISLPFLVNCSDTKEPESIKSNPIAEEEEEEETTGTDDRANRIFNLNPEIPEEFRERNGLPNFFSKVKTGKDVTVAYLGGSITNQNGWRPLTFNWIKEQYPTATLTEVEAAISGTGVDFAASRAEVDLLDYNPDLVFVEFRVNGGVADISRSIEGLVREIRAKNPETDICFVYTIGEWMLNDLQNGKQYWIGKVMEEVANKYGIPSIDFGVEVVKLLKEDKLTFKAPAPESGKLYFSKDGVHPKKDGYELYANTVIKSFIAMENNDKPLTHAMPTPVKINHFQNASLIPITNATTNTNWSTVNINTDAIYRSDRDRTNGMLRGALKTDKVGETLTINWEGVLIGFTTIPLNTGMEVEISTDGSTPKKITLNDGEGTIKFAQFFYAPETSQGSHTTTLKVTNLPEDTSFYCGQFIIFDLPN
ncbi:SGNH/GDSL hydrolase family protein [Flavivirga eckloniae]|uniref:Acyl-CoA thioesterase n=1 Tax=Flavivirga eckloniae TaxID=1803846 RepID=A0A2K9PWP7_9FLAO|nr:SGNH/GDSL hydrolase family protein [Flavivirga eckloniae]AUP81268.1 acyl-CoA thioesterase [Flavivirga eckloniae]